jgi:hypothetical protein
MVERPPRAIQWFPGVSCEHPVPIDITTLAMPYCIAICNACGGEWHWPKIGWRR